MGSIVDTKRILKSVGIASPPDALLRLVDRTLGVRQFERLCSGANVTASNADVRTQIREVFSAADIGWQVEDTNGVDFPSDGPVVFYSNHPYGFADALIGLDTALARRPDTRVLANSTLAAFDFNAAHVIHVDLGSGADRIATNRTALRETLRHLQSGGALLIFPSQACSHLRLSSLRVTDPPWTPHLLALIDLSEATCVPLYFEGRNSWRFQLLGLIHPVFRTMLLLREFVGLEGRRIRVRVGKPIPARDTAPAASADERLRLLRERVYALHAAETNPRGATVRST